MVFQNSLDASTQGVQYLGTTGIWSGEDGGAAGNLLTSNGTGVASTFQNTQIGNLVLISNTTATSASSVNFTNINTAEFTNYILIIPSIGFITTTPYWMSLQFSTDNGATYISTGYSSVAWSFPVSSLVSATNSSISTSIYLTYGIYAFINLPTANSAAIYLNNLGTAGNPSVNGLWFNNVSNNYRYSLAGGISSATNVNAFTIFPYTGTLNGTFLLYGIKQ